MRKVTLAALIFILPLRLQAQSAEEVTALERMYKLYAHHAGVLASCHDGPGRAGLEENADRIAEWRHSGVIARVSGERSKYRDRLLRSANLEFSVTKLEGACPGSISRNAARQMLDVAADSIASFTRR